MLKRIAPLMIFLFAVNFTLTAQITTSTISGTVKNASDEPLVGATITATHQPSGTKYVTTSRAGGQYSIANMRVGGPYTIEVTFVGFVTDRQEDVFLKLAEIFYLNTTLKPSTGELTNVVITTGARRNPILNAKRTGAVTNIGIAQINRLPSISRSINDLTRATPQSNGQAIGGGNFRQNNFTIDGADFNNNFGIGENLPASGAPISLDALEEISVNITPFDVRQSGFIGSAINAVTRSGTNKFSGSVYNYFRNEKNKGDQVGKATFVRPREEFDQWGFRVGGPIIKNKLFFFFAWENETQPTIVQTRVAATPSAAYGSAPNIARPTVAEMDMISDYLLTNYGYVTGPYENYSTEIKRKKMMGRIDWNISNKHKLNIRYTQVEGGEPVGMNGSRSPFPQYTTGQGRTDVNALWFKNSNYFQGANFYSLAAELNSNFGKKLFNTFRATYTFQNDSRQSDSEVFPFVDILKDGQPFTSFGYEPFTFGNLRKVKTYSFVNNLSWTTNKHNWTVGAQVDLNETVNGFQRFGTSYYTFASWNDFISGAKPVDFALTYSLAPGFAQSFPKFEFAQYSIYGQDEIAINKDFRLTLGLRLDRPSYPDIFEVQTHPLVANLTFANGEKINTGNLPGKTIMWSPRMGFNWDLYGDRSLQIRGGTGIFTGKVPFVWVVSQSGDAGMLQVTQTFSGQANTPGAFNPDPAAYRPATPPAAGTVIPNPISALVEDFKNPQSWKSSLAIDKRLPGGFIASIEAIYNKDINTAIFRNANLVSPTALAATNYPDNRLVYPSGNAKYINRLTSGLPNPNGGAFNAIVLDNGSKGYYFSLTGKIEKQFSNGLFASLAYVKSMAQNLFDGNGSQPLSAWQGVPGTPTVNGANNPILGNTSYVIPDRIVGTFSYRKEYLKKLGTTISVIYNGGIQDRFSYTYTGDFNNDGANFDLIYVPRNASEIDFVAQTVNGVNYTAQQQSDIFFAFIEQDKYLKTRKGQYAERNGAKMPWLNRWDVKILQDVFTNIGKNRNTIQFSLDIFNFANLINKDWGELKTINASSILTPVTFPTPGSPTRPTFRLALDRGNLPTSSFRDNVSVFSTYSMQFGFRYIFNN